MTTPQTAPLGNQGGGAECRGAQGGKGVDYSRLGTVTVGFLPFHSGAVILRDAATAGVLVADQMPSAALQAPIVVQQRKAVNVKLLLDI